jgi:hypothetical protein
MTSPKPILPISHLRHQPKNANQTHADTLDILDRVGVFITKRVGTMWAAIIFAALAFVSLPAAIASHDKIVIVAWIAQTFLQLVLLPIIMVGQNIQGRRSEILAEEEFNTTQTTYKDLEHLIIVNKEQLDILVKLSNEKR